MKLLLDQGLPRSAALLLRAAGLDADHVGERGYATAADSAILALAAAGPGSDGARTGPGRSCRGRCRNGAGAQASHPTTTTATLIRQEPPLYPSAPGDAARHAGLLRSEFGALDEALLWRTAPSGRAGRAWRAWRATTRVALHVVEGIGRNAVRAGPVPAPNEAHGDVGRTLAPLLLLG